MSKTKQGLQIGAYLDQDGNAFVGQIDNTVWLHFDLPTKYTRVLNENGGEVVSVEDIAHAFANHDPKGNAMFFDNDETKAFYHNLLYNLTAA